MNGATRDFLPLGRRLGALFLVRLGLSVAVVAAAAGLGDVVGTDLARVAPTVAVYLVVSVGVEALRQRRGGLPTVLVNGSVLLDGVFLTAVVAMGGGPGTAMASLLYVHLIAVTLLASYRTGLKVAVWQSLLLITASYLPPSMFGAAAPSPGASFLGVVSFLAVAVVTAVCSSLNERELRRSRAGFRALAAMASEMEDLQNPDEVVAVLLRAVPRYLGRCRVALYLRDEASVTTLAGERVVATPVEGSLPDRVALECWQQRRPLLVAQLDPVTDAILNTALPDARNVVLLPFAADGQAVGVLAVERGGGAGTRITAGVVSMLSQFATHAALSHRNVRLMAEVKHLATVDALTGLPNRRTFEDTLQREVARGIRTGAPLTLLLLDVDHFKAVNDAHGHPMGDEVLRHVGQVLAIHGREEDLPARYGGEEFAILLPGCPSDEAIGVAERLRAGLASADAPLPITASVGAASLHSNAVDAAGLIRAADEALYTAKTAGRNRTVAATTGHLRPVEVAS